jgi:NAD(P)-dependent dehydrogenase (short-subunit alcohol dehydrogenase family)
LQRSSLTIYSGIGLETAVLFLREGANVLLSDISGPALEKAVTKLKAVVPEAKKIETKIGDVSKEADVQAMVEHVDSWGGLDVLFNNAGIMHSADDDAVNTPEKIWDLTQAINVKGVWFGSKHAVISFRKHGKKKTSVINTASVVALVGSATPQLAYTASKGAVLAMTRELAMVHAREGFRFNALCPAPLKYVKLSTSLTKLLIKTAPRSSRTGSATTKPSVTAARSTSPLDVSVRLSSKLRPFSSLPATRVASSTARTSWSTAA